MYGIQHYQDLIQRSQDRILDEEAFIQIWQNKIDQLEYNNIPF